MNICYQPWVGLDISPQGEYKPCCKYSHAISDNYNDYRNSDELNQLKLDHLNGKRPDGCARCWKDEDNGLPSKRQMDYEYHLNSQPPELEKTLLLSVAFGNTCNLACRICSSYSSSRWSNEAKKLGALFPKFMHQQFYKTDEFKSMLNDLSGDLVHIDIPGGEPFLTEIPEHIEFLKHLIAIDNTPSLHYTTNGTQWPKGLTKLWNHFPEVDIQLSLDGTGSKFEYQRWPAKWDIVYENIKQFQELSNKHQNIRLSVSHSVSIYNILDLDNFKTWCDAEGLPIPWIGLVTKPEYLDIKCAPENFKDNLDNIDFDNFIKYVNILDSSRGQNFKTTFPELWNLINDRKK